MRPVRAAPVAALLLVAALLTACGGGNKETVVVFAAASLTDAYQELAATYEADHPDASVELVLAGSNQLARQILDGGPADLFAPADLTQFDTLIAGGTEVDPVEYAANVMVLAVPADNPASISRVADHGGAPLVAACAEGVPCGAVTRAGLAELGIELDVDTLEVDVRAVRTKLELGEVDAGFIYASDLVGTDGLMAIGEPLPVGTVYAAALITDEPGAQEFLDLVLSGEGRAILTKWGFR
ncbi:MAG: molybdate ABC transporter substrate-binding protein [Actinomycetia bacterium]|nr:molybdate ABC transporter substrate-binding protein [Actinomycetes bacterium]